MYFPQIKLKLKCFTRFVHRELMCRIKRGQRLLIVRELSDLSKNTSRSLSLSLDAIQYFCLK